MFQERTTVLSQHILCWNLGSLNCPNITTMKSQNSHLSQYHNLQVSDDPSDPKSTTMTPNRSRMVTKTRQSASKASPGPWPFANLWDWSCSPKSAKYNRNSRSMHQRPGRDVWELILAYLTECTGNSRTQRFLKHWHALKQFLRYTCWCVACHMIYVECCYAMSGP